MTSITHPTSTFTTITLRDGATVRAKIAGDGPPLLMLPNMVSWQFWCHQIPVFARHFRVIAPEYRNQEVPGLSALDTLAADVPDLLQALGYDHATLMGHSIGSMVLTRVLETEPQIADAVVLVDGFWRLRVLPTALHRWQPRLVPVLRALYPRIPWVLRQIGSFASLWLDEHIFLHSEPNSEKQKMFWSYPMTKDISMVLRVGAALEYHQPPELRRATMPVLVVSGAHDRWMPVGDARRLARSLPSGEHVIFPTSGHMVPMIVPDQFNQTVLGFLRRVQPAML